jgi:Fur family ferric uptake transcriptional regulator
MTDTERKFCDFLKSKGLKLTPERKAVVEACLKLPKHFEAEDVYLKSRESSKRRISRATVYRTLPLVVESGLLREVVFTEKHTHYEATSNYRHHEHLVCIKCGKVIEFTNRRLEDALEQVARDCQFKGKEHKVEIVGYCRKCR